MSIETPQIAPVHAPASSTMAPASALDPESAAILGADPLARDIARGIAPEVLRRKRQGLKGEAKAAHQRAEEVRAKYGIAAAPEIDEVADGETAAPKRKRKRRGQTVPASTKKGAGRPAGLYPGQYDLISQQPQEIRDEIDRHLLNKTLTCKELAKRFAAVGLDKPAQFYRRRARLKAQIGWAQVRDQRREEKNRVLKRTVDLLDWPLEAAQRGFDVALAEVNLDSGDKFLNTYLKVASVRAQLTGELPPAGQVSVNQDNRTISVLSLPRCDDPKEVIEASERLVAPPSRAVIDVEDASKQ